MTPKTMRSQLAGFAGGAELAFHVCAPLIKLVPHWPPSRFTDTSVARLQGVPMVFPLLACRVYQASFDGRNRAPSGYSCRRSLSLDATTLWVWLSTTPRYRARLEQWIVASLCRRNADDVLRLVERNPGTVGSRRRSEGRSWVGTTDEM